MSTQPDHTTQQPVSYRSPTASQPPSAGKQPVLRSWPKAFLAFLRDQRASIILKLIFGFGPLTILDDIIPGIGQLDDPLIPLWLIVVVVVFFKVRAYRDPAHRAHNTSKSNYTP